MKDKEIQVFVHNSLKQLSVHWDTALLWLISLLNQPIDTRTACPLSPQITVITVINCQNNKNVSITNRVCSQSQTDAWTDAKKYWKHLYLGSYAMLVEEVLDNMPTSLHHLNHNGAHLLSEFHSCQQLSKPITQTFSHTLYKLCHTLWTKMDEVEMWTLTQQSMKWKKRNIKLMLQLIQCWCHTFMG